MDIKNGYKPGSIYVDEFHCQPNVKILVSFVNLFYDEKG